MGAGLGEPLRATADGLAVSPSRGCHALTAMGEEHIDSTDAMGVLSPLRGKPGNYVLNRQNRQLIHVENGPARILEETSQQHCDNNASNTLIL